MPSKKKLQVFISSTYTDLIEERQAAVEAVLTAGHIPAGMELFSAGDQSQMDVIKRWIDESDVYLLILGGRYGSIEPKSQKSYVQLEYEYAIEKDKPVFALVIVEEYLKEKVRASGMVDLFEQDHPDKLKAFRNIVLSKICRFWDDNKAIKLYILETMAEFSRREELKGWISGNEAINSNAVVEELARLARENTSLREQLAKINSSPQGNYSGLSFDEMVEMLSFYTIDVKEIIDVGVAKNLRDLSNVRDESDVTLLHLFWVSRTDLPEGITFQGNNPSLLSWFKKLAEVGLVDIISISDDKTISPTRITIFKQNQIGIRFLLKLRLERGFIKYENYAGSTLSTNQLGEYISSLPNLPPTITLMEMLNISSIDQLQEFARVNWQHSMNKEYANWLYTQVGLLSDNEPRVLTFSADADGVHGIIAGSTGSGKSELLMTLIIGLALNFSPDVLNFVLIDYKGGSAFEPLKNLPHVVDIITNLDQSGTARVFTSIIAELDRRQRINTDTYSKDIIAYRRKGLNLDPSQPRYPHLFIVIDEFAEMISGNVEYKAQLEDITRLGRALGVTLILAAQRPVGVTDQMRANIKFRICLRVETPDDSREVLRRADAAYLPPDIPGRGYLQIGNELVEIIQTAYTGGDYKSPQEENVELEDVFWDHVRSDRPHAMQDSLKHPKLYDIIVGMLNNLSKKESRLQWRPWPEFLPTQVYSNVLTLQTQLDTTYINDADVEKIAGYSLNEKATSFWDTESEFRWDGIAWGQTAMRPLIGLIDNPYQASQKPLMVNFPNGHAVVFGLSGRGKTTFLRTVITSLALTHSPDELHIYILDFGRWRALSVLSDLPHIGAVITSDEDERVQRALRKVNDIIDQRQVLFSEVKVNNLDSYNLANPEKRLPAVLVVIDNFSDFKEYYENLMGPLIGLVREARAYGVHFIFTAEQRNALSNKLYSLVTERFTLKLSDAGEYSEVVGRGVPADLSVVPGRGYVRTDNRPLEFQTALTFNAEEDDKEGLKKIGKMCLRMKEIWNNQWKGEKPSTIMTLPVHNLLDGLLNEAKIPEIRRLNAIIGIDDRTLEPALIDIERQGPHLIIIGPPFSGKTTALRTMILSIAYNYSPDEVMMVLVDYSRKLWRASERSLADLPHVVQTIEEQDQLDEFYQNLSAECSAFDDKPKRRKIMIFIDNYDAFTEESSQKNTAFFENASGLIRKYQTAGVYMVVAGSLGILSATDDLRKVFAAPGFGIALKNADAVNRLNGRFPRSLAEVDLPMGRAFIVRSGITSMLQLATPYANDDDTEGSLDAWVDRIRARYPQDNVQWLR